MTTMELSPAYRIHTQRMVLRCWQPGDAPLLSEAIATSLDHLQAWMLWAHEEPRSLQQRVYWLRQQRGQFDLNEELTYGIFNQDETIVLGSTGLHGRVGDDAVEIGYWIHVNHINQGLATEASAALTRVAFEIHNVDRVEIHCDPANVRSASVPRKLGFVHEATLKRRAPTHNHDRRDSMIWSIWAADYLNSIPAQVDIEAYDALGERIL